MISAVNSMEKTFLHVHYNVEKLLSKGTSTTRNFTEVYFLSTVFVSQLTVQMSI